MPELRPLSPSAVPSALARAERYRLLGEGDQAESICLDILAVEPDRQDALVMLILAITDQFRDEGGSAPHVARAEQLLPRLADEYARAYYRGVVHERRARAAVGKGRTPAAHAWLTAALESFDRAIALRPAGNDEAVLRWNACVRALQRMPEPALDDHRSAAIMSE